MKKLIFFLVGGAIRDDILNFKVDEKDWLICEPNITNLDKKKFKAIGNNFVIFLNYTTKEEHALPRKKNKNLDKYMESRFVFGVDVEEDLLCRDLTINSFLLNENGKIIDPLNNRKDIKKKILLSSSFFFQNDKIRIFRAIRFFVKYYFNGFSISPCTYVMILEIVLKSEAEEFKIERILKEIQKVSKYNKLFFLFYEKMYKLKMLNIFFKDLNILYMISEYFKYNGYINFSSHISKIMYNLFDKTNNNMLKFSILFLKLGYINNLWRGKKYSLIYKNLKKKKIDEYKSKFIFSKKFSSFLETLSSFYFINKKKRFDNKKIINLFIKNICLQKNKIKIINIIMILSINEENNSITNEFYLKYFFLEILNEINKKKINEKNIKEAYEIEKIKKSIKKQKIYEFYEISK